MTTTMTKAAARMAAAMLAASAVFTTAAPAAPVFAADKNTAVETVTKAQNTAGKTLDEIDTRKQTFDMPVEIVNHSGKRLEKLYIAAHEDTDWGTDIMGEYYLNNGGKMTSAFVAHGNYTSYDVHAVYQDGSEATVTEFDLSGCPTTGFTLELKDGSMATSYASGLR